MICVSFSCCLRALVRPTIFVSIRFSPIEISFISMLLQVYDRCRGIDHDPVEPDPIPSRVSSQLSLAPLITPAHCLGNPGKVRSRDLSRQEKLNTDRTDRTSPCTDPAQVYYVPAYSMISHGRSCGVSAGATISTLQVSSRAHTHIFFVAQRIVPHF